MPATFLSGPNWQGSSGPIISREVQLADIWPEGLGSETGGGDKDVLEDGMHQVFAIGSPTFRPNNITGVTITYDADADRVNMNLGDKVVTKAYVSNILTYSGGDANSWAASLVLGRPVFIDDSDDLQAGTTLSLSPLNDAVAANPLAGYIWYCQDEYQDDGVGGARTSSDLPHTASNSEEVETFACVLLVNDSGQSRALLTE